MALFFDQTWFDDKLASLGFDRAVIASALGLNQNQIDEVWKDQREISAQDVATLAALLQVDSAEIATRAGVSTPSPKEGRDTGYSAATTRDIDEIKGRLDRLEKSVAEILAHLRTKKD